MTLSLATLKRQYLSSDFDDAEVAKRIAAGERPFLVKTVEASGVSELVIRLAKDSAEAVIEVAGLIFDNEHTPRGFKIEVKQLYI